MRVDPISMKPQMFGEKKCWVTHIFHKILMSNLREWHYALIILDVCAKNITLHGRCIKMNILNLYILEVDFFF